MASEPETAFALDFQVLPHLRGYPEELHRYANLMKQTHPRGISALEFLLNRPHGPDGFLETICRNVRDGITVLTGVEVATRLDLSPAAVLELAASSTFPSPLFRNAGLGIWRAQDIDAHVAAQADGKPASP